MPRDLLEQSGSRDLLAGKSQPVGATEDAARSFGTGLRTGLEYLAGTAGDAREYGAKGVEWLAGKAGASPETAQSLANASRYISMPGMATAPTTDQVQGITEQAIGDRYQPQTTIGEYARTAGEFAPAALQGGGGLARGGAKAVSRSLMRRGANVAAPAALSETAGQLTENTDAEPYARMIGALVGGAGASRFGRKQAIASTADRAPTAQQIKQGTDDLYSGLRQADIQYAPQDYAHLSARLQQELMAGGTLQASAPQTWDVVLSMYNRAMSQPSAVRWDEVNTFKRSLGSIMSTAKDSTERGAAKKAFGMLSQFEKNNIGSIGSGAAPQDVTRMMDQARDLALRGIKGRQLGSMSERAETYISGAESGLRNQAATELRNKRGNVFNDLERDALFDLAGGSLTRNTLSTIGRGGIDVGRDGNISALIPGAGSFGALAYGVDPLVVGSAVGGASAAKIAAKLIAKKDMDKAMGLVRAGPRAQQRLTKELTNESRDKIIRQLLLGRQTAPALPSSSGQ